MKQIDTKLELSEAVATALGYEYTNNGRAIFIYGENGEVQSFDPATDLNHAFEGLEEYCDKHDNAGYRTGMAGNVIWCGIGHRIDIEHESLAVAICLAILDATGYEYKLGGELI